jgi:hypothetical protein
MESDGGFRKAGARLDQARHAVDGTPLGRALVAGLGAPGVAAALAANAAGAVAGLLAANGDDVLCDFEVRLDSVAAYRKQPGEFEVHTPSCTVKLTWTVQGLPHEKLDPLPALGEARRSLDQVVESLRPAGEPQVGATAVAAASPTSPDLAEPARRPIAVPPTRKAEKGGEA